jgi:hypothetical protein
MAGMRFRSAWLDWGSAPPAFGASLERQGLSAIQRLDLRLLTQTAT